MTRRIKIIDISDNEEILLDGVQSIELQVGWELTLDDKVYEVVSIHNNLNKNYVEYYVNQV